MDSDSSVRVHLACHVLYESVARTPGGLTAEQIAAHLDMIATEGMGLKSNMDHCRLTALKLLDWRATLLRRRPEILG